MVKLKIGKYEKMVTEDEALMYVRIVEDEKIVKAMLEIEASGELSILSIYTNLNSLSREKALKEINKFLESFGVNKFSRVTGKSTQTLYLVRTYSKKLRDETIIELYNCMKKEKEKLQDKKTTSP